MDYTRMIKKQTDGSRMLLLVVFLIHHSLIFRCRCKKFPPNLFQFQLPSTIHLFFSLMYFPYTLTLRFNYVYMYFLSPQFYFLIFCAFFFIS